MATILDVKRYWDRRPCNIHASPALPGTERWAFEAFERKLAIEPHLYPFLEVTRPWRGKAILDAGCGIGIMATIYAKLGACVTAVDISPASLGLASDMARHMGARVDFYETDLEQPLPAVLGGYDLVWCWGVAHHSPHPERVLSQLRRVTRPGGQLKLMVYHRRSWKVWQILWKHPWSWLRRGIDATVALESEAQGGCPITFTYTVAGARRLVEAAGWRVKRVQIAHIFPWYIPDYVQYVYTREWYWRLVPEKFFQALESFLGWHLLIDAEAV